MSFIPVADIINFSPLQAAVGVEVELEGTVMPLNATNTEIDWSIVSGDAVIRTTGSGVGKRSFLSAATSNNVVVRAIVRNGIAE